MNAADMDPELDRLRSIGLPEEMERPAQTGTGCGSQWTSNSHIHLPPNFSAFESITQAVRMAAEQRVQVLGISNYYDFEAYPRFASEARSRNIFPLFGLEIIALLDELKEEGVLINDPGNPGRMYICGKGIVRFAPLTPAAGELLSEMRRNDGARMRKMIALLEQVFASGGLITRLTEERILDSIARRNCVRKEQIVLQERHVAKAFQEALFELESSEGRNAVLSRVIGAPSRSAPEDVVGIQNEIRSHLMKVGKPAFVPEKFLDFGQAFRLILELGGIPCYPTLADGTSPVCPYEHPPRKLVEQLIRNRIHFAEFIPIRNKPEILGHYVREIRRAGIVVTGGTEHNTTDLISLEPFCKGGAPVPGEIKEIFSEGACVVAAHQHLVLHGKCGYVDSRGCLNPAFPSSESRIEHFRGLGAAVIARYHERNKN